MRLEVLKKSKEASCVRFRVRSVRRVRTVNCGEETVYCLPDRAIAIYMQKSTTYIEVRVEGKTNYMSHPKRELL